VTLPRLTAARAELLRPVEVVDEQGQRRELLIPHERPLTLFVDRRELVTLMTLGVNPELLTLGYLLNQQLIGSVAEVESVTVDWSVHAAAVKTHGGALPDLEARTAQRVVTTGCGQGTVFGSVLQSPETLAAHAAVAASPTRVSQAQLLALLELVRLRPSIHRQAGSVHGCALFDGHALVHDVEDVGRHNAIDTLTGWMAMNAVLPDGQLLYTTGRLTSEMVMKAALMRLPVVVSRNGVTAMGLELAERLGMTLIGRAVNRRWLCYCGAARLHDE
jgi:FdhD protein